MKYIIIISLFVILPFGTNLSAYGRLPMKERYEQRSTRPVSQPTITNSIIANIPDMRSIAGSAGKNIIFAEDGHNVAVIYGLFSGDPDNIMQVYVSYSTDRGLSWLQFGPISTYNARRVYSGLDASENWPDPSDLQVYFAWNQATRLSGMYLPSPVFLTQEFSYPDGLISSAVELPNSEDWDVWVPCIGVKDSVIVITANNNGTYMNDCYIWRIVQGVSDSGRLFLPGPLEKFGPHFRFGSNGYMFFFWLEADSSQPDIYCPYYCESFDYALTWTEPRPLPAPCSSSCHWYGYDCEVVRDTPVAVTRFLTGNYEYGKVIVYRPDSGGPGNWHFKMTILNGDTLPYARLPNLAADDSGNTFVVYTGTFIVDDETVSDCGVFARPAQEDTWYDWGRCTFQGNVGYMEAAHNAPIIANGDSTIIGLIHTNAGTYPNTGNLYFDCITLPNPPIPPWVDIKGELPKPTKILVSPNPSRRYVKFVARAPISSLVIYNATGKLVASYQSLGSSFVLDGQSASGGLNPGVYFYSVRSGSNLYQGKIVLSR